MHCYIHFAKGAYSIEIPVEVQLFYVEEESAEVAVDIVVIVANNTPLINYQ